jgi:hypothetical protein
MKNIILLILFSILNISGFSSESTRKWNLTVLNPGCITSPNRLINHGAIPAPITATVATNGTCSGSYSYQWQKSIDDSFFVDIPGATSQNLNFADSLSQTTYFQRKTTCGSEVKFTLSVSVSLSPQWIYYNSPTSDSFTRNNCPTGYTGTDTLYLVDTAKYSSTISKEYVDSLALNDLITNGQAFANTYGSCIGCNTSNCYGINKKCINGVCETGTRVNISSERVWEETHWQWYCTYVYCFSDLTTSEEIVEPTTVSCLGFETCE